MFGKIHVLPVAVIAALCGGIAPPASAQPDEPVSSTLNASVLEASPTDARTHPTFEDEVPSNLLRPGENQFFTFNLENDLYGGNGTDRHYTNGVRFSYFDLRAKPPSFTQPLSGLLPMFNINESTGVVYSFGQNLYTPDDIKIAAPQAGQRPWAAFLYGSVGLASVEKNHVDELELTLGVVGPAALGEPTQKLVHRWVGSPQPKGWDNQLHNEPGVILAWQRRWPEWFHWQNSDWTFSVEPNVGLTGGNIYTYAATGIGMKFGPADSRWQDTPVRVQPAMPGTGFYGRPTDNSWGTWFLFAGANGRAMARNIFLDGNSFDGESPHVDKEVLVGDLNAGVAVTLGRARLSYATVYRTREYKGQDSNDLFGVVNVGYRF